MTPSPYWTDGTVSLYVGDCREVLPALGVTADLVPADPPYEETSHKWDRWPHGWLETMTAVSSSLWCFGSLRMFMGHVGEFRDSGWKMSHDVEAEWDHVVWEKHNGSSFATDRFKRVHEIASHWYRGRWDTIHHDTPRELAGRQNGGERGRKQQPSHTGAIGAHDPGRNSTRLLRSVLKVRSMNGIGAIHPHEKPTGVLTPLIEYACPPGGLVIDPFAGSASTLDAARQSGRRAIGIEANEAYAEKAKRRLSQMTLEAS